MSTVEGQELLLRAWEPDDAEFVFEACQDPNIQRWTTVPRPYLRKHAEYFVNELSPTQWEAGAGALFVIVDAATGERLGSIALADIELEQRRANIGYWVTASARGQGIATRALKLLVNWAFAKREMERLQLFADTDNAASRAVAQRAGFTFEGVLAGYAHKDGMRRDQALYAMLETHKP